MRASQNHFRQYMKKEKKRQKKKEKEKRDKRKKRKKNRKMVNSSTPSIVTFNTLLSEDEWVNRSSEQEHQENHGKDH